MARLPKIPSLLAQKIYKTGQTRGADDDQIFQNRVGRNSTVLIPYSIWTSQPFVRQIQYENGFIVLISPQDYLAFQNDIKSDGLLSLGHNLLIFYELRADWVSHSPQKLGLTEPNSRKSPLGGEFVARIANTTSASDKRINVGYTTTGLKGAGIRQYEYANSETIKDCRIQLEAMFWHSVDSEEKMQNAGMSILDIERRRNIIFEQASQQGLLDYDRLVKMRILNEEKELACPLCLEPISSAGFLSRLPQATGRERHDLTVTEINLFHIKELAYGTLHHTPYNLGWGHHHCNVVCKDAGIFETLNWMKDVLKRNSSSI